MLVIGHRGRLVLPDAGASVTAEDIEDALTAPGADTDAVREALDAVSVDRTLAGLDLSDDRSAEALVDALGLGPLAVPSSGLVLHLRAGDLSGSDGDPIGTWGDSGFDFTAAGSARPALRGPARGIGGRAAVLFDGSDDVLSLADADLDLATLTIAMVVQASYTLATSRWLITRLHDSAGGSPYSRVGIYHPASGIAVRADGSESTASFTDVPAWGAPQVWVLSVGAAGTLVHVNGRAQLTGAATSVTYPNVAAWCLGGRASDTPGEWWKGKVGDVAIYSGQLSASDRQKLEGALATYYGITLLSEDA